MAELSADPLETILRHVAAAAPEPWYPKLYAESSGVPRDSLDAPLEKLRLANLIRLTEWVQGRNQGYVLTPEGMHALNDGRELGRVRDGKTEPRPAPTPVALREARATAYEQGEDVRKFFLYPINPIVTKSLLFANVLVFLAGYFLVTYQKLDVNAYLAGQDANGQVPAWKIMHAIGGMDGVDIARGGWEWVRLLTSCFVHIGFVHLLMNCAALYMLGRDAESMFGHGRFLLLYLLAGFGGSCGMLIGNAGGGAGASGAVCGLLGSIIVWFLLNRAHMPPEIASRGLRVLMINVVLVIGISLVPHVSLGGHLGGAIAGAAVAVALHFQRYGRGVVRWLAILGVLLVPAACLGTLLHAMNTQIQWVQLRAEEEERQGRALRTRYREAASSADTAAREAYSEAFDVFERRPDRRDIGGKRERAINALAQARANLEEAILRFSDGFRMGHGENAEAREGIVEYLRALTSICGTIQTLLQENREYSDEELETLSRQAHKLKELQERWERFIR